MSKRILVIDDDPDILDAIRFTLESDSYKVTTNTRGEYIDSLIQKKKNLPDLIVLDVLLSGNDGRVLCTKLKSSDATRHIPVLMISAHPEAATMVANTGANAFLAKPFQIDELLSIVRNLLFPNET